MNARDSTTLGPGRLALACAIAALATTPAPAQTLLWTRQAGTPADDKAYGVAVDGTGNAYITGYTGGGLFGPHAGFDDAFLAKYNASGAVLWTRQLGTPASDYSNRVAVDGAGNVYITGSTEGSLFGPNTGSADAFVAKYNGSGTLLWARQFGTQNFDYGYGVALDGAGNAYIAGHTSGGFGGSNVGGYDAFLVKYDASGAPLWARQTGTASDEHVEGVAVDVAGNAYLTGYTGGSLGGPHAGGWDAFLTKYDGSGSLLWVRQVGTPESDNGHGVAVDGAGNAYFSGITYGSLFGPVQVCDDAFLAKYDPSGAMLWARQVSTPGCDYGSGVGVDGAGDLYLTGDSGGSLFGPNAGHEDVILAKYNPSGALLWGHQFGTSQGDAGWNVALDGAGNAYVSGYTAGSLGGPHVGGWDVFLARYGPPCYPDCDASGALNVNDYICFQTKFALGDPYADCDGSGVRNVSDYICFQTKFALGCS